jgi:hypothetical protein
MANIVPHTVYGSKENAYHDFVITVDSTGQTLTVSAGSYWQNNIEMFNNASQVSFDIPTMPTDPSKFQDIFETCIFITKSGIVLKQVTEEIPNLIDRLVWFSLTPDFQSIQVEYTTMIDN